MLNFGDKSYSQSDYLWSVIVTSKSSGRVLPETSEEWEVGPLKIAQRLGQSSTKDSGKSFPNMAQKSVVDLWLYNVVR